MSTAKFNIYVRLHGHIDDKIESGSIGEGHGRNLSMSVRAIERFAPFALNPEDVQDACRRYRDAKGTITAETRKQRVRNVLQLLEEIAPEIAQTERTGLQPVYFRLSAPARSQVADHVRELGYPTDADWYREAVGALLASQAEQLRTTPQDRQSEILREKSKKKA